MRQWITNSLPDSAHVISDTMPATPTTQRTFKFLYHPGDSILIARTMVVSDSASIFSNFVGVGDTVSLKVQLLRARDNASIATLDSILFVRAPGSGIPHRDTIIAPFVAADSSNIRYKVPTLTAVDTGFVALTTSHSTDITALRHSVIFRMTDSLGIPGALKKAAESAMLSVGLESERFIRTPPDRRPGSISRPPLRGIWFSSFMTCWAGGYRRSMMPTTLTRNAQSHFGRLCAYERVVSCKGHIGKPDRYS